MKHLENVVSAVKNLLQPQSTYTKETKQPGNVPITATEPPVGMTENTTALIIQEAEKEPAKYCRRCGRILKSKKSKQLGYGISCYKKHISETIRMRPLFTLPIAKVEDSNENN